MFYIVLPFFIFCHNFAMLLRKFLALQESRIRLLASALSAKPWYSQPIPLGPHQQPPKKTSNFRQAWHLGEQTNHNKSPNFWNSPAKYHISLCGYECNAVAACRQASETKLHHREELEPKRAPRSFLATWMDKLEVLKVLAVFG